MSYDTFNLDPLEAKYSQCNSKVFNKSPSQAYSNNSSFFKSQNMSKVSLVYNSHGHKREGQQTQIFSKAYRSKLNKDL